MISQSTIHRLNEIDFLSVIQAFSPNKMEKAGVNYKGNCPFHDEDTPSFVYSPAKHLVKCFGCGEASKGTIAFVQKIKKIPFYEACVELAKEFNINIEYEELTEEQKELQAEKKKGKDLLLYAIQKYKELFDNKALTAELKKRDFTKETAKKFNLGYAPDDFNFLTTHFINNANIELAVGVGLSKKKDNGNHYDAYRNRLIIPITEHYNNEPISIAGRDLSNKDKVPKWINGPETYIFSKREVLFGLHQAKEAICETGEAIVVEGYTDVMRFHQNDLTNTVGSMGTAFTIDQLKLLNKYTKRITFCYDGDAAGREATLKAVELTVQNGQIPSVLMLPDGYDPGDLHHLKYFENDVLIAIAKDKSCHGIKKQDGLIHLLLSIVTDTKDRSKKAEEVRKIVDLLVCLKDEILRDYYIEALKLFGFKITKIKDQINKILKSKKEQEKQYKQQKLLDKIKETSDLDEFESNKFFVQSGRYKGMNKDGNVYEISNFTMESLYHIRKDDDTARRLVKLIAPNGKEKAININTDDFTTAGGFNKICARCGPFIFKGSNIDLFRLQEHLFTTEKPSKFMQVIGLNKKDDVFLFGNGLLDLRADKPKFQKADKFGIISANDKNYFVPAFAEMYEDKDNLFQNQKKFYHSETGIDFKKWSTQFNKVYGPNGNQAIVFMLSCLFRDIVRDHNFGKFPILFAYGPAGSGKGSMIESLYKLGGKPLEQLMLGSSSTTKAYIRSTAQIQNWFTWMDEYKDSLPPKFIEMLKNFWDCIGYKRAAFDSSFDTDYIPVNGGVIVSGQEMPLIEPAFFSRVLMLIFQKSTFTKDQKTQFAALEEMERKGVNGILVEILKHKKHFKKHFKEKLRTNQKELIKEINDPKLMDRMLMNANVFLTIFDLANDVLDMPIDRPTYLKQLVDIVRYQIMLLSGNNDVSQFWEVVQSIFMNGDLIKDKHFSFQDGYLFLHYKSVHAMYEKEMSIRRNGFVIRHSSLRTLLELIPNLIIDVDTRFKFPSAGRLRAIKIDYRTLITNYDVDLIQEKEPATLQEIYKTLGITDIMNGTNDNELAPTASQTQLTLENENNDGDDLPI